MSDAQLKTFRPATTFRMARMRVTRVHGPAVRGVNRTGVRRKVRKAERIAGCRRGHGSSGITWCASPRVTAIITY